MLPCSHGLLVRLFIYLLSCQYRNPCKKLYSSLYFVALYFTRLLLSGFSLCITRIKNLFFKEIDKTFCCFRYSVICNLPLITSLLLLISCFYVKLVKLKSDFIYRMLARGCYFYQLPFLIRSNLYTNV